MKKKKKKTPPPASLFPSTMAELGPRHIESFGAKRKMKN